jgi:hypothetical protein
MASHLSTTEIIGTGYHIQYSPQTTALLFQGILSLSSSDEYAAIADLLDTALQIASLQESPTKPALTLNLCKLEFLNSSGINTLAKFVIRARHQHVADLVIQGTMTMVWQTRSLKNLQRLMPTLQLEWLS